MLPSVKDYNILKSFYHDKERSITYFKNKNEKLQPQLESHKHDIKTVNNDKYFESRIRDFIKFIQKETFMNFYLAETKINGEMSMIKRDMSLMVNLSCNTVHDVMLPFVTNEVVLALNNISSMEKGKAYSFINRYIGYAKKVDSPIILWTETEENTKYFERYGFVACGRMGDNNEMFMVLNP
jgi:NAD+--asparagine ADP-ribosyltransferase